MELTGRTTSQKPTTQTHSSDRFIAPCLRVRRIFKSQPTSFHFGVSCRSCSVSAPEFRLIPKIYAKQAMLSHHESLQSTGNSETPTYPVNALISASSQASKSVEIWWSEHGHAMKIFEDGAVCRLRFSRLTRRRRRRPMF